MESTGVAGLSAPASLPASARLAARIDAAIGAAGGWLPFDRYMAIALYEPGLGYYARPHRVGARQFGRAPASGSDFVTAPELTPLYGRALARQVAQVLDAAQADGVTEFGAGSGALAAQLLEALGGRVRRYAIVEVSAALRAAQAERLARWADRVVWLDAWPDSITGAVVGNEVLDAMPVQLLHWDGAQWFERGVAAAPGGGWCWADRPTALRPPLEVDWPAGSVTEIHPQAVAWVRELARRLERGAALLIDYGFPESEYYLAQRSGGTLMCHRGHRADTDPLAEAGAKDITAHVDFTAIALAAQEAGMSVVGYTSQARFLVNCGLLDGLAGADARAAAAVQMLLGEHEMGELFKVLALARGLPGFDPLGFAAGDRTHRL
ncbi:MAG: SAM-dependent methyltransferase [Burkholderiales bacterium]|nr:SAM-dependent methyltransferase [Burkholderiales bacterium]MDE1928553.1 SAM-dependent methyltransferase [Burkholderiales bacterium]MDE2502743.1 SAM-dependent methyltransferase [Burkholderiales bacterium]